MNSMVLDYLQFTATTHLRCAAHNLHLSIREGLKIEAVASLIIKIRRIAAAARTPKIDATLSRKMSKGAILDQVPRWGGIYFMVKRLLKLKDALVDIAHPGVCLFV